MDARKATYKLPPLASQQERRQKALEDQKKRRAQRIDSSRQLDIFASLNLGESDDEEEEAETAHAHPGSLAAYASMLNQPATSDQVPNAISSPELDLSAPSSSSAAPLPPSEPVKKSKKRKGKKQRQGSKANAKWADKCMYAELLEMRPNLPWASDGTVLDHSQAEFDDGLPLDLEHGWVAVAPIPVGKRCLAVTHQSAGVAGLVPNTTLRSRLLGKCLLRFPSPLPPLTVLDCILDSNWRQNGILHVLDVVRWKGQDVSDCEAAFRFWWRDTRLTEMQQGAPLSTTFVQEPRVPAPLSLNTASSSASETPPSNFRYPTTFVPVPFHSDTSLHSLLTQVIPAARAWRSIQVSLPPIVSVSAGDNDVKQSEVEMSVEQSSPTFPFGFGNQQASGAFSPPPPPVFGKAIQINERGTTVANTPPDGMLLYVSAAAYEPGTSPLACWVPATVLDKGDKEEMKDPLSTPCEEPPLDVFERLVQIRLARQQEGNYPAIGSINHVQSATDDSMDI
ncbi:hypothetical protein CVT24_002618 [Panaeolus cyanescens]|uniref:Snurportin-1 n=1 Tax=Panaeolus cyanescens TaxID=181874 RepID=A0A409YTV4_9AGAR|nr:hypothetical protein CVT24_002618 [Panaeolus cyanescens]